MNTRLQVEHTITEMVTGIDLVREQLRIAAGEPLSFAQDEVRLRGHSIQCRINAEDPAARLRAHAGPDHPLPRAGRAGRAGRLRRRRGRRRSPELYDPMIAKLIVWDADRDLARRRMLRALSEFEIEGVSSLIPLHMAIIEHPEFAAGGTLREFVEGGGYAAALEPERAGAALDGAAAGRARAADAGRRGGRQALRGVRVRARAPRPHPPAARRAAMADRERSPARRRTT